MAGRGIVRVDLGRERPVLLVHIRGVRFRFQRPRQGCQGTPVPGSGTIRRSLDFALEAELDIANFNPLTPTPGSALYERLRQENRLLSLFVVYLLRYSFLSS